MALSSSRINTRGIASLFLALALAGLVLTRCDGSGVGYGAGDGSGKRIYTGNNDSVHGGGSRD